jgi:hypothetical protein
LYELAFDEEIARSISGDIPLAAVAVVLIGSATVLTQYFRRTPSLSMAKLGAWGQGLILVHFSAQFEPCLTQKIPYTP